VAVVQYTFTHKKYIENIINNKNNTMNNRTTKLTTRTTQLTTEQHN